MAGTLIPTIGKSYIIGRMDGTLANVANKVAWGVGVSGPVAGDTTLGSEASEARVTATITEQTITTTNDTYQAVGTLTANGSKAITECGLLDAASSGNLVVRSVFAAINVVLNDTIQFTFKIQMT